MEGNIPEYDVLSLAAFPMKLHLKETGGLLGIATGFFFVHNEQPYLITNWHVVTGLDPQTKKPVSTHAGMPDMLSFQVIRRKSDIEIEYLNAEVDLFDAADAPNWSVHPTLGEKIDVVAMSIKFDNDVELYPLSDNKLLFFDSFDVAVADEVFVLGFPFGLRQLNFPLWKRGSIATEPNYDYDNLPLILIDTATRPGMSGAPVIVRKLVLKDKRPFFAKKFLGIYSGRYFGDTEIQAQLGRVWKKSVIIEIIEGKVRDKRRF